MNNTPKKLIETAKQFDEQITALKTQFFSALDDYKKYYVYYNKNPEVNEFQNYYANSKNQLQTISKKLVSTTTNIYNNIDTLNKEIEPTTIQLETEKTQNKKLTKLSNDLEKTQNGTEILIDDSKSAYNTQYYYNWEIIVGILVVGGLLSKLFKTQIPSK